MAYQGLFNFDGAELFNLARTKRLSDSLGIGAVRRFEREISTLERRVGGLTGPLLGYGELPFGEGAFGLASPGLPDYKGYYSDPTTAPWYDANFAPSAEFAGFVVMGVTGLDDSTMTGEVVEYIDDGGSLGIRRQASAPLVWEVVLVASTEAGAAYGKRWLDSRLRGSQRLSRPIGADLTYLDHLGLEAPAVRRREVATTRGASVTRRRSSHCAHLWWVTFTMHASDPYAYGGHVPIISSLGGPSATGPEVVSQGSLNLNETGCPVYDYAPIYDPNYPALVPPPASPFDLPPFWTVREGDSFRRHWARTQGGVGFVSQIPMIRLSTSTAARMVRVAIWDADEAASVACGPLFVSYVGYLPVGLDLVIDSEKRAAYTTDAEETNVRRADSIVFGERANPVRWTSLKNPDGYLVTLDTFADGGGYQGGGNVRASLDLVARSD